MAPFVCSIIFVLPSEVMRRRRLSFVSNCSCPIPTYFPSFVDAWSLSYVSFFSWTPSFLVFSFNATVHFAIYIYTGMLVHIRAPIIPSCCPNSNSIGSELAFNHSSKLWHFYLMKGKSEYLDWIQAKCFRSSILSIILSLVQFAQGNINLPSGDLVHKREAKIPQQQKSEIARLFCVTDFLCHPSTGVSSSAFVFYWDFFQIPVLARANCRPTAPPLATNTQGN